MKSARNVLDSADVRNAFTAQTTDRFVGGVTAATYGILLREAGGAHDLRNLIYNCEYSTVSATIIWLQERGVIIPADVLAALKIEGGPAHAQA